MARLLLLLAVICTTLLSTVYSWPAEVFEEVSLNVTVSAEDIQANLDTAWADLKLESRQNGFNPQAQFVPTTGQYAFRPPGPNDQRGNCPGLNALANHGYIPRNGIATTAQMSIANQQVFGMGPALATILSTFGSVMNGDLVKFSIGGPTPYVPGILGLLGTPQGMSGNNSHNKYENDGSATRGDLYLYGESSDLIMSQFKQLFDMQPNPATANYNMQVIFPFHAYRFQTSVATNPYFFNAFPAGTIFGTAGHNFIYRFMANHSAEYPEGYLNQEVLKSFFAVSGPRSNFVYTRGWERIPDNWYRRPTYYDLPHATADIIAGGLTYPYFLSVGGNTGRVNSFTGINLGDLTGGVFRGATLLQGNNLICFALQVLRFSTPDLVTGPGGLLTTLLSPVVTALNDLSSLTASLLSGLSCPQLRTYDKSLFDRFPGATGL